MQTAVKHVMSTTFSSPATPPMSPLERVSLARREPTARERGKGALEVLTELIALYELSAVVIGADKDAKTTQVNSDNPAEDIVLDENAENADKGEDEEFSKEILEAGERLVSGMEERELLAALSRYKPL